MRAPARFTRPASPCSRPNCNCQIGGEFFPGPLPAPSDTSNDPVIVSIDAPGGFVNGSEAQFFIHLTNTQSAANIESVLVKVNNAGGFDGYWEVPAVVTAGLVEVTLQLNEGGTNAPSQQSLRRLQDVGSSNSDLDVIIAFIDRGGHVGPSVQQTLPVLVVSNGVVEVTLTWDTLVDLDLHVVEPSGEEIYYGNKVSVTGGTLDLDSNAGCVIDGKNTEHVYWLTNAPPGQYSVRVDFYEDCQNSGAHYTVTMSYCGQNKTLTGSFAADSADAGGAGSGVVVTNFTVNCISNDTARVRGTATYEKLLLTTDGLSTVPVALPIAFASVELDDADTGETLQFGSTAQDGTFDFSFTPGPTTNCIVKVFSRSIQGFSVEVTPYGSASNYVAQSDPIDLTMTPDATGADVHALITPQGSDPGSGPAAAFNMVDLTIRVQSIIKRLNYIPNRITWNWTKGHASSCGNQFSCYNSSVQTMSVASTGDVADEYNEMSLLRMLGFYLLQFLGSPNHFGPVTSYSEQTDPNTAWTYGAATWLACSLEGSPIYLDVPGSTVRARVDISSPSSGGTSDGTMTGNYASENVAGILWGLGAYSSPRAVIAGINYFGSPQYMDRGAKGPDLVDFLDGWFCEGGFTKAADFKATKDIIVNQYGFPYDFAGPVGCGQ